MADTWSQWSKHVLAELERLDAKQEKILMEVQKTNIDIARLQMKAGIWGALAGTIPAIIAVVLMILKQL